MATAIEIEAHVQVAKDRWARAKATRAALAAPLPANLMARPAPVAGDRVLVWWLDDGRNEHDLVGYLLPSAAGVIVIAQSPEDDGREDKAGDWWRATFLAAHCTVAKC